MGGGKLFNKKGGNVRVFRLVNRSVMGDAVEVDEMGNPLPDRVFAEVTPGVDENEDDYEELEENENEYVDVGDAQEVDQQMIAERAGEAAKYGILYDDRHYDYTQHLKPIGKTPGGVFVAATATTIDHNSSGTVVDPMAVEAAETRLNHATYDHLRSTPDVDPAVLQTLEALEDDAFVDEDAFEDDFIVKLDREETSIMASLDQLNGHQNRGRLDKDFANILKMYDEDGEGFEIEESYEDIDVEGYGEENFSEDSGLEGNNWHQLDEVRRELVEGDPKLLERILYTSDEEEEGSKKKHVYQIIDVDVDDVNRKEVNCQTASDWLPNRNTFKPKIIRATPVGTSIEPIRISRKTGMPLDSLDKAIPIPGKIDEDEESETEEEKVNKGEARKKGETAEEKRARKAAVKLEKKENRVNKKEMAALQKRVSA